MSGGSADRAEGRSQLNRTDSAPSTESGHALARVVGRSAAIRRVLSLARRVAPTRATVLVTGETGTGKELVARAVHDGSTRASRPFVATNCSALPESLLESELFGHEKGAFTGAIRSRQGLFEVADGGTLFLDEVSTLSDAIQIRLLRVLQERVVTRVGGQEEIPVDFRLLAATNVDLGERVREDGFREDLYYRLNVFPIRVPPLRERPEDIPLLADHFRLRFAREHGLPAPPFSSLALARMQRYAWPGNVRELENHVERALIMHSGSRTLPFEMPTGDGVRRPELELARTALRERWSLDRLEREYILAVLEETRWRRGRAAGILGIDRRTLYRKLKRYEGDGAPGRPGAEGRAVRAQEPGDPVRRSPGRRARV